MATDTSELFRIKGRIETEKNNLEQTLKDLTDGNGSGILHDMKVTVNAADLESDLGKALGNLGGKVYQASNVVIDKLDEVISIMDDKLSSAENYASETEESVNKAYGDFGDVDFSPNSES